LPLIVWVYLRSIFSGVVCSVKLFSARVTFRPFKVIQGHNPTPIPFYFWVFLMDQIADVGANLSRNLKLFGTLAEIQKSFTKPARKI